VDALNYLQTEMVENMLDEWLEFVQIFRNLKGGTPGGNFLPEKPDTSKSLASCTTPFNNFKGECISTSECTGATFNGLCPGSSSIKCCVAETRPANPTQELVSFKAFRNLFNGISETRAEAFWPYFNEAMDQILRDNPSSTEKCHRVAAFVAQIGHESAGLLYFEELASGSAYEGRCSGLGNCQPGDGRRYKGRGPIQLTGRANYREAGRSLGLDLEIRPEQVCFPSTGFKTATWFWMSNNLNRYCTGNYNDFTALSRRINGGYNGITDRRDRWAQAKSLLSCPEGLETSYVLELAGIEGNTTDEDKNQDNTATIVIATVVPCTLLIVAAIIFATFMLRNKRHDV